MASNSCCLLQEETPTGDKPPAVASNEDKPVVESKPVPPVAEKPSNKSPAVAPIRRHKVAGVPLIPVTQQMEEILNRQRLATESAIRNNNNESAQPPRSMTGATKAPKFPPPAVKKKPVRAPVKSSDFLENDEKKPLEVSSGLSRSCENLATADDDDSAFTEQTTSGGKLNKRISTSLSVEDISELKEPVKPPAVKARKLLPGAVKLIAPKPKEGQMELTSSLKDEVDFSNPTSQQDKDDASLERSRPQTPETTPTSPENKEEDEQSDAEKLSEAAAGGSGNADILSLLEWTTEDVCVWLQRCGFGEHATAIRLGNVNGKALLDMDNNRMKVSMMYTHTLLCCGGS